MTAATQFFHHNLNIDLINRPGTEINGIIVISKYHRSLNALDLKKLISRLKAVIRQMMDEGDVS